MNRIVVTTRVGNDGSLHLDLPVGAVAAGMAVQVTVELLAVAPQRTLLASDLLRSGLVGIWAERTDLCDSLEYARRLREQAQTRRHDP